MEQIFIKGLPKVELHIHLEGTLDTNLIVELAEKNGIRLPRPKEELITFSGLADFLELLNWICSLVRDGSDARRLAYRFAQYASGQNIMYAEVMTNPTHWKALPYSELIPHILEGFEQAYGDGYCDCRLLVSLLRSQTRREALEMVRWMKTNRHPRLLGLSVDGNEAESESSNRELYEAFWEAKNAGFGVTVHAGESSPAAGVTEALDLLGAMRIDHGVRAVADERLLKRLSEEQIPLNVCLTSNLVELYPGVDQHPLGKLYELGIPVTVNTDDPELLGIDLCGELELASGAYGWDRADLVRLEKNAVRAAFCDEETQALLFSKLEAYCRIWRIAF